MYTKCTHAAPARVPGGSVGDRSPVVVCYKLYILKAYTQYIIYIYIYDLNQLKKKIQKMSAKKTRNVKTTPPPSCRASRRTGSSSGYPIILSDD